MLSTLGLELSRVLDPHLTWKTASNGRQRAVRRARTSFTEINRKKCPTKSLKASKELTDKDSKLTGDMPVSESEKLGVSILGRRFSDTRGSVPIKKRRVLLAHSTSPPHQSSHSNHSGHVFERKPVSYQDTVLNEKQHSPDTSSGSGSEFSHERNSDFEKPEKNRVIPKICDAADFSGISILAAAACDSNIGGEFLNVEATTSKLHSSELQGVQKESNNLEKEELLHTSEDLAGRTDLPFETSSFSSALPSKESNEKSDGSCNLGNSVNSIQTIPNKTMESSSRDVRFHWDLNTVMDTWDSHEEGLNSEQGVIDNVCEDGDHSEDGDHNEEVGNVEPFIVQQVGFGETKNGSTDSSLVDTRAHSGGAEKKVICALEVKIEEKPCFSSGNSATDVKESNPCFSPENGYAPVEWKSKAVADVHGETKSSINKDWSCSVSGDFHSPTKGAMVAVMPFRDSSLSTASRSEEEKTEAHCINFQSKVGSENSSSYVISRDNAIVYHPNRDCEPHLGVDKVPVEAETCVQMVDVTHVRSHTTEKHASFFDSGTAKSEQVPGCVISGANTNMNASDEADHCDAGKPKENDVFEFETSALEMKVDNTKCCAPNDIDAAKKDSSIDIGLDESLCNPRACKNNTDRCIIGCGQVASEDRLECGYYSAAGMEKVELSGDDDSQYEDGELRESLENCWLDDGGEEGETERVDYGTDKDTDGSEAGSDLPASVNCYVNNLGMPDVIDAQCGELGRDKRDARSDTGNGLQGHLRITAGSNYSNFGAGNGNVIGDDGFLKQAEGYRGSIHSANYRMKMSGWDKLPGGGRFSGSGTVNSRIGSSRNHNDAFSDPSRSGGSMKKDVESSLRRDISSRTERGHSTDVSRRSDNPYFSTNRNPRAERDGDEYGSTRRSFGRSGLPPHLQGRDRGDWWEDNRLDSSGYSHHGSKNAAAAAVAKVESNGFVVAPDGTIIKSGVAGSPGHLTRRPAKPSSQNACHSPMRRGSPIERARSFGMHLGPIRSREMSPDRPLFIGRSKAVRYGVNHVERYRGPVPDDIVDSLSPMHRPISRRDRSFSPLRRPLHMSQSHSRSPSRSRTRSPHRWASLRGRINYGMSRGPVLRRRSRSPSFKSGFRQHAINYASLSRNPTSPPHSSRWTDGRKKYEYRRCPGSPPPRVLSRGHRFDSMDSPGRTKPDDYYRPAILGRLPKFDEFDGES